MPWSRRVRKVGRRPARAPWGWPSRGRTGRVGGRGPAELRRRVMRCPVEKELCGLFMRYGVERRDTGDPCRRRALPPAGPRNRHMPGDHGLVGRRWTGRVNRTGRVDLA
ncbi:protein of unknown function [Cyanobium sp. NIES-981]|nr:protein of unknown function [Cyanobium sp. NIES-981]